MTATMVGVFLLALIVHPAACMQDTSASFASARANPIRKVVTMLQVMQKKVEAEGVKEKALYDKFMCYCKNGKGDLEASIAAATIKGPQLASDIEAGEAKKAQLTEDLFQHKKDRDAAKAAIAEATSIRAKEAAAFAKEKGELDANLAALAKATSAIEGGMTGAFLQTSAAQAVLSTVKSMTNILEGDREEIVSFLTGTSSYAPASGEIVGILKEITDEMSASLSEATKTETAAIETFEALVAAKKKEIAALTESVEKKSVRVGDLGVEIATMKNDMSDTEEALVKDKEFLAKLSTDCSTKTAEWDEIEATRALELVALADTIKILNDDDALDLFKKTLPGAGASALVQLKISSGSQKASALALLSKLQKRPQLDFIMLALRGKKIGFEKVIKMIDGMVGTLKTEQLDDDHKKEYCGDQFDLTDDKLKALAHSVADTETNMAMLEETISTLSSELKALEDGITALDKLVSEATEQRKAENIDYTTLMADDSAAKELLSFAINRLNKFYNPKLYAATNFQQMRKGDAAPPPAPAAPGPYKTKSAESTSVIAMIKKLIADLDKEMQEAKVMEADAQKDYEAVMAESAEKRAADSKSMTEKESAKAEAASSLDAAKASKAEDEKMTMATESYKSSLHAECDWLLKYFDVRAAARTGEIDSLEKAKAVLSGADYSFVQTKVHKFLQRA